MISKKTLQDLKIIKANLAEILGFVNNKVIPPTCNFATQQLTIYYPGLITNLILYENDANKFPLEVSKSAYDTYSDLIKLDPSKIEVNEFTNLSGVDVVNYNLTTVVYLLALNEVVIEYSSLLYELFKVKNQIIYKTIEQLLRIIVLCSVDLEFKLTEAISSDAPENISLSSITNLEVKEVLSRIEYVMSLIEKDGNLLLNPLLWEMRKLSINLIMLENKI